jgi:hypothetical protein
LYRISLKLNTETFPDQNENHFENGFGFVFRFIVQFFSKWVTEYFSNQIENQYRKIPRTVQEYLSPFGGECRPLRGRVDR